MMSVSLPIYEGFTQFAVWPADKNVSFCFYLIYFTVSYIKCMYCKTSIMWDQSYYGLLSASASARLKVTPKCVTLPFTFGLVYVAFPAVDKAKVLYLI